MCRRSVARLRRLDLWHRLEFRNMLAAPPTELPVPLERALAGMPMRTADGRVLVGFDAFRRAMSRTAAAPAAWVLYVPGLAWIGRRAYRFIADHRRRDEACHITPAPVSRP
jgi:predicted DCC family thiol-disulfide oxidoreductase YuxK